VNVLPLLKRLAVRRQIKLDRLKRHYPSPSINCCTRNAARVFDNSPARSMSAFNCGISRSQCPNVTGEIPHARADSPSVIPKKRIWHNFACIEASYFHGRVNPPPSPTGQPEPSNPTQPPTTPSPDHPNQPTLDASPPPQETRPPNRPQTPRGPITRYKFIAAIVHSVSAKKRKATVFFGHGGVESGIWSMKRQRLVSKGGIT
jgi:hypothetical protein